MKRGKLWNILYRCASLKEKPSYGLTMRSTKVKIQDVCDALVLPNFGSKYAKKNKNQSQLRLMHKASLKYKRNLYFNNIKSLRLQSFKASNMSPTFFLTIVLMGC